MGKRFLLTSESVTEGHPDKICDQVSDAILDAIYKNDPRGRVACETLVTRGLIYVAGEITTSCYVEIPQLVRSVIRDVGYVDPSYGFDYQSCGVMTAIQEQSADIALGVDTGGAGDQGMMFGFACDETKELMPLPIILAHKLVRCLAELRVNKTLPYLRPDGKSQVTVEYEAGKPKNITSVIIGAQHNPDVATKKLQEDIKKLAIDKIIPKEFVDSKTEIFINATGRFEIGGPVADTGVTGRKIMVDTYGGYARHGGGCFSGKDPTKVDRSAAYMARYLAKNIVAAGIAQKCEVQLAYCIGVAQPVALWVDTFGTSQVDENKIVEAVRKNFDLSPKGIIDKLHLRRPLYRKTACYGHFGRENEGFPWEDRDSVGIFKDIK